MDGVSVLICCHNGAARIGPTIEALAQCKTNFPAEIVLVDNNSIDGMVACAQAAWERTGNTSIKFRIVSEPELGLAYARRKGVREAKYECIVFCDDDNWLSPNYLEVVVDILSNPAVGAAGGQAEPVTEGPIPVFLYSHGSWLALGVQSLCSGDVTRSRGYLWGAGLAARRSDLLMIYQCPVFPILTDRTGASSSASGNDREICWALTMLGKTLVYDERLKLRHFVTRERLQIEYFQRLATGVNWDGRISRLAEGMHTIEENGRVQVVVGSAVRWVRNWNRLEERRFHAWMVFAACGWKGMMSDLERKVFTAFQFLRPARLARLRYVAARLR
jgi:glycosyltransferase involved in cell wall biosynthesis